MRRAPLQQRGWGRRCGHSAERCSCRVLGAFLAVTGDGHLVSADRKNDFDAVLLDDCSVLLAAPGDFRTEGLGNETDGNHRAVVRVDKGLLIRELDKIAVDTDAVAEEAVFGPARAVPKDIVQTIATRRMVARMRFLFIWIFLLKVLGYLLDEYIIPPGVIRVQTVNALFCKIS